MKPADRTDFLATVPDLSRGMVKRAFEGKCSPRAAIKAKCLDCTNWDREEVEFCTVILCPLHAFRPYQKKARKGVGAGPVGVPRDGTGAEAIPAHPEVK